MKASLEQMKTKFMSLSQNRSDEIATIYGHPGADCLSREEQWQAILDDAPSNRVYLQNALGMGKDGVAVDEEPKPSTDDKVAEIAVKNPTLSRKEVEQEAKAAPSRPRTHEELADVLWGRGRY